MAVVGEARQCILGRLLTQMILELALLRDVLNDDLVTVRLALIFDFAAAEPDFNGCAVLPFPFGFQGIGAVELRGPAQQLSSFGGITEDLTRQIHRQQFLAGRITQHGRQRRINVEEFAFKIAPANSIDQVSHQSAVASFGMAQPLFSAITLFAKMVVTEGSTNGYGKVPEVIHAHAIGGAAGDKFRRYLWLHGASQKNTGDLPFA